MVKTGSVTADILGGVLVIVIVGIVVIVTWESKANSSSSLTELQTGTELGKNSMVIYNYSFSPRSV